MENRFSQNEQVSQAMKTYLQKRNYPAVATVKEISESQMILNAKVQSEVGRSNSIVYTCINSDPMIVDLTFSKFIQWVNDLISKSKDHQDLNKIMPPLFCHLFIELHQKVHKDKEFPWNFFKFHLPTVEKTNTDNTINELLNILQGNSIDLNKLKETFRSNKYCVQLCSKSVVALKKYLAESSHVILLQILQTWFNIKEEDMDSEDSDVELTCTESDNEIALLKDIIALIKINPPPIYAVHLSNTKDDVTAGCIDRRLGLVTYSYNGVIFISSLVTLKQLPNTNTLGDVVIYEHSDRIYDMKISNQNLLTASNDTTIKLFDLNHYKLSATYRGHEYPVYCLTTSPNGSLFVSGSYDHTCRLWSYENKDTLRLYAGHMQEITSLSFHSNSKYFVSGSADKTIRMWSIEDTCPVRLFLGSAGSIYSSAFSESGKMLATAGDEKTIRIWDITKGQQICNIKTQNSLIIYLLWCTNDTILCSGTSNGLVQFWDVKDAWQKTDSDCPLVSSQELNKKLLDLKLFNDTINCFTAQSALSTTATNAPVH